jgi:hypothetical protein
MNPRLETPTNYARPTERGIAIRLLRWPMWERVPLWDVRVSLSKGWVMFGPYELRLEVYKDTP